MGIRGDMRSFIQTINLHSTPHTTSHLEYFRSLSSLEALCLGLAAYWSSNMKGGGGVGDRWVLKI